MDFERQSGRSIRHHAPISFSFFFFKLEISFLLSFFLSFFLLFFSFAPRSSSYRRRISTADEYFTAPALCVCVCVCGFLSCPPSRGRGRRKSMEEEEDDDGDDDDDEESHWPEMENLGKN